MGKEQEVKLEVLRFPALLFLLIVVWPSPMLF